jgi:hypothetical protein
MRFLTLIAIAALTFASHNVSALPLSALNQAGGSLHLTKRNPLGDTGGLTDLDIDNAMEDVTDYTYDHESTLNDVILR